MDDYAKMQQMFFGDPPAFEPMLDGLSAWEAEFNRE